MPRGQAAKAGADTSASPEELAAESTVAAAPSESAEPEHPEPEHPEPEHSEPERPEPEHSELVRPEPECVEPEPASSAESSSAVDESVGDEAPADTASDDEPAADEPAAEPVLVPHRPAGRVLKAAAVVAAVLFVAAGAFAGASAQRYLLDRAEVQVKFDVAKTAADAITTLFTYTPDDLEQLPRRSSQYLSGDFAADYKRYIDSIVAPNKQAQVSNQTQVLGAAVESLSAKEATAIVYTNSVSTTPVKKGLPSLQYRSYRLDLQRDDRRWFVTRMTPITTLDLTPRL